MRGGCSPKGSPGTHKVFFLRKVIKGEDEPPNLAEEEPVVEIHVDKICHEGDLQDRESTLIKEIKI